MPKLKQKIKAIGDEGSGTKRARAGAPKTGVKLNFVFGYDIDYDL